MDGAHTDGQPTGAARQPTSRGDVAALALILFVSASLRFASLSYSHFQGDEVKALYPPSAAFPAFLLAQRKAPAQFLLTRLTYALTGGFDEALTRLPFAAASLAAVLVAYALMRPPFGRFPALLSAALIGTCGLLTAFGRIVQYQSLLMLAVLATALFAFDWMRSGRPARLYLASLSYGLALLTHYDALVFAPTLAVIGAVGARRRAASGNALLPHLLAAPAVAVAIAAVFYVPFVLQPGFAAVRTYLLGRVAAGSGLSPFASVGALLGLYLPPGYLVVAIPLLLLGIVRALRERDTTALVLVFWFVSVFAFYMLLGGDPRSHVYTYFLPGLLLVALGVDALVHGARVPRTAAALRGVSWLLVAGSALATQVMLVDHRVEHPWAAKSLLCYPLPNLTERDIDGVFGFPYRRGLDQVGALFASGQLRGSIDSNERVAMIDHYVGAARGAPPDYYIYVHRPLSLERTLPPFIAAHYHWLMALGVGDTTTIEIYAAHPPAEAAQP
jgi:hypothetical protein